MEADWKVWRNILGYAITEVFYILVFVVVFICFQLFYLLLFYSKNSR